MLPSVPTTPKSLEAYRPVIGDAAADEILELAGLLKGARVLHVNATGFGGGVATDSCIVVDNIAYWLGKDGIYEWSDRGIVNIAKEKVNAWFTTDTYFNRSRFPNCYAGYNSVLDVVYFHLAAAGSSSEDRWIAWHRKERAWLGPHKTDLFTPNATMMVEDANSLPILLVAGTNGVIYSANRSTRTDGAGTAVDMDVYGKAHDENTPDIEKFWGEMSILSKKEASGSLTVTPYFGVHPDSLTAATAFTHDLTTGRERLGRVGQGGVLQLRFRQNTAGVDTTLLGYEIPNHELGRR